MNTMTQTTMDTPYRQHGAALVVSLLFLLIMTVIGVTALQVASLEERISGNLRSRNLAFQAAETALRVGEADLNKKLTDHPNPPAPAFDCANGLYGRYQSDMNCDGTADSHPLWQDVDWSSGSGSVVSVPLANVPNPPAYIVQIVSPPVRDNNSGSGSLDVTQSATSSSLCFYRITARGTGSTLASVVILQSIYSHAPITVPNTNQVACYVP